MNICADLTFGIDHQARAILAYLSGMPPSFAPFLGGYVVHIRTYPWYNGRERGAAIVVSRTATGPCRVIVFGEARSSDAIFVEYWEESSAPFNGPTIRGREKELGPKLYENKSFDHGDIGGAAECVYSLMAEFYKLQQAWDAAAG